LAAGSHETPDEVNVKISLAFPVCLAFVFVFAASSCAKTSVVGTSGEAGGADAEPPTAGSASTKPSEQMAPKVPSVISTTPGVSMIMYYPILGDVDGDGFDDFFVQAIVDVGQRADGPSYASKVFLYYGRPEFPAQLTTEDADAVFTAESFVAWALGDINGDGLSDFSLGVIEGTVIVFGSKTRYAGSYAVKDAGIVWTGQPYGDPELSGYGTLMTLHPAGDVNGDGIGDLIVNAMSPTRGTDFDYQISDYLVLGNEGPWVSGQWDPSSAAARFGSEVLSEDPSGSGSVLQPLSATSAGDLDGDGFSDLFARTQKSTYVFYGGPEQLQGELGPERADARFELASGCVPYVVGDLDADGRSDLAACNGSSIDIVYGPKDRFSGTQLTNEDFRIETSLVGGGLLSAAAGDIDSDGFPELVVSALAYRESPSAPDELDQLRILYTIHGTGERHTGTRAVSPAEATLGPAVNLGVVTAKDLATRFDDTHALSLTGDLDGDGGYDILVEGSSAGRVESGSAITLIPSTPRAPD
jgi:hypothetical protein